MPGGEPGALTHSFTQQVVPVQNNNGHPPASGQAPTVDLDEARRFLRALDPTTDRFCFQTFDDDQARKDPKLARVHFGTLDAKAPKLSNLNDRGCGIFVVVSATKDGAKRRTAKDIDHSRAHVIDVDIPGNVPAVRQKIAASGLTPSITVESSPGKYHFYWSVDDCSLEQFQPTQQALIDYFGSDPNIKDLPRVMRIPGFIHRKETPVRTRLVEVTDARYHHADVLKAFGLTLSAALPGTASASMSASVVKLPALQGTPPSVMSTRPSTMTGRLAPSSWFDRLDPAQKNEMLRAIAEHPGIVAQADLTERTKDGWLQTLFAFADAERLGATEARDIALSWAKTSKKFKTEADFDKDWLSFNPNRSKVSTVGTLIKAASEAGVDLSRFRDAVTTVVDHAGADQSGPFFTPVPFDAASLRPVPWLAEGLLIRGELTVLAGQGAGAKTATAIALAVAAAAGRHSFGPFPINNRAGGLRVAMISAEENHGSTGLLIAAAANVLALTPAECGLVAQNLVLHDAQESGWRLGEPRPDTHEAIAPAEHDQALITLETAVAGIEAPAGIEAQARIDMLVVDTMAALFAAPNENDNNILTNLMRRLRRAARKADCGVLIIHHTPKMSREAAAAQRGEATIVRGGSAITNTPRVALSITALPADEGGRFSMRGLDSKRVRRIEHIKINDMPVMEPAYVYLVSEKVKVHDGSETSVRAVTFTAAPDMTPAGIAAATKNLAMTVIMQGTVDKYGAPVPLSPSNTGNSRNAVEAVAQALMGANPMLTGPQAKAEAQKALKHLTDIGVVKEEPVDMPKYKPDGSRSGTQKRQGLICHPELAPWVQPSDEPSSAQTEAV
jgi:hypothetical protein